MTSSFYFPTAVARYEDTTLAPRNTIFPDVSNYEDGRLLVRACACTA